MNLLQAAALGIVEGLTEFLPISSTGHLILTSKLLSIPQTEFLKTFEIAIQLGAILAVVILYWRTLVFDRQTLLKILAAFIPTAIIGFTLHHHLRTVLLESTQTVLWALFIGGIVLIAFDFLHREKENHVADLKEISYKQAVIVGICQALALIPGVSRAGATIVGGQLLGIKRKPIVEFSFLLAIPTMAAATGLDVLTYEGTFNRADMLPLAVGFLVSFLVAYAAVRWFLQFIQRNSFWGFGVYRIVIALVGWILLF